MIKKDRSVIVNKTAVLPELVQGEQRRLRLSNENTTGILSNLLSKHIDIDAVPDAANPNNAVAISQICDDRTTCNTRHWSLSL